MSQIVSNSYLSSNPDFPVADFRLADGAKVQVMSAIIPLISNQDVASASVIYTGYALRGSADSTASWFIMKSVLTGNVTSIRFASLPFIMDQIWDNRASLTYS